MYSTVQYSAAQDSTTALHHLLACSANQQLDRQGSGSQRVRTVQYDRIQYSTVEYCTVPQKTVQNNPLVTPELVAAVMWGIGFKGSKR